MKIISLFEDIFLDKKKKSHPKYLPHDLTEHYRNELKNLYIDSVIIATKYSEIEYIIERFKYFSEREYVEVFVDLLSKVVEDRQIGKEENALIIPVPMHWSRYFTRGFDNIAYIVEHLSKKIKIPYKKVLSTKWSYRQSRLSRKKRLENKINVFRMKDYSGLPETIIIFDDVISTGATANECARVLKENGAKRIVGIFLASNF